MQLYVPSDKAPRFAFPIVFNSFSKNSEVNALIEMRSLTEQVINKVTFNEAFSNRASCPSLYYLSSSLLIVYSPSTFVVVRLELIPKQPSFVNKYSS
jgi:hypothetical protein